jgi:hypothetical protein
MRIGSEDHLVFSLEQVVDPQVDHEKKKLATFL